MKLNEIKNKSQKERADDVVKKSKKIPIGNVRFRANLPATEQTH